MRCNNHQLLIAIPLKVKSHTQAHARNAEMGLVILGRFAHMCCVSILCKQLNSLLDALKFMQQVGVGDD